MSRPDDRGVEMMFRVVIGFASVMVVAALVAFAMRSGGQASDAPRASASVTAVPSAQAGTAALTAEPRGTRAATVVQAPRLPASGEQAEVVRVVDGDTIDVRRADGSVARVRYIGINTPETVDPRRPVECFGKEASARNGELVTDQTVLLEKDVSETDQYGRLLRYVWVGDLLVNAALVGEGYARPVTYPPDVRYADWYFAREREARAAGRGLWSACRQ